MAREGRAACERLLAIGVWTFVWSFAGVDSPVTSQRARIAEWLWERLLARDRKSPRVCICLPSRIVRTCAASRQCARESGPSKRTVE